LGTTVTAVTLMQMFQNYQNGVDKVLKVNNDKLSGFTAKAYADVIKQVRKRKRKISFALLNYRQYLFSSLVAVA
jgi:electron transfer flavoprotein alpha subunit